LLLLIERYYRAWWCQNGSNWAENKVVFLETQKVGRLVYGILWETVNAATYAKAGKYILIEKWSEEEPFSEHTSSQALAIPVMMP
jgi:hypothetical protein